MIVSLSYNIVTPPPFNFNLFVNVLFYYSGVNESYYQYTYLDESN